ncbi:hypothetical protein [Streptomyces sp. NEAU-YJ-81]|uniref:hypothetical protein n=1 Tax=Streptomyces sp. NEAU-YJ-81 TaxID=2820288 RepID=UPI001ABC95E9|nr:hypothetical protein [Streptomyces sp. NEAU-YJ-81]MBO3682537.1 hypothetical protein [Streptomyces sp. NEAU-YJ-81]
MRRLAVAAAAFGALALPLVIAGPAQADTQQVYVWYTQKDAIDVTFYGTVRPNGPYGYIVEGDLFANCHKDLIFDEQVELGTGATSRRFEWTQYGCNEPVDKQVVIYGDRPYGDSVDVQVGGTSGFMNTWTTATSVPTTSASKPRGYGQPWLQGRRGFRPGSLRQPPGQHSLHACVDRVDVARGTRARTCSSRRQSMSWRTARASTCSQPLLAVSP